MQPLPEELQRFLLQTALLDRLCVSLCLAVTGSSGSATHLDYLKRANLFITSLDDTCTWYRYHQLFADFLRVRLGWEMSTQIAELHLRAAQWYELNGYYAEAMKHLLIIPDGERAAQLCETSGEIMLRRGELATLRQWIDQLPMALVRLRPYLCLIQARVLACLGILDLAEVYLQIAEEAIHMLYSLKHESVVARETMDVEVIVTRAMIAGLCLRTAEAVQLVHQALERLPADNVYARSVVSMCLGIAYRFKDTAAASQALNETIRNANNPHITVLGISHLAYQLQELGQLHRAAEMYQQALQFVQAGLIIPSTCVAYLGLAELRREWNDLETAAQLLEEALTLGEQWAFIGVLTGIVAVFSLVKLALGETTGALVLLQRAEQRAQQELDYNSVKILRAYHALIELRQGKLASVQRWAEDFEQQASDDVQVIRDFEYHMLARVYIAQERYDEALEQLARLLPGIDAVGRMRALIKTQILQALAYQGKGDKVSANSLLARALTCAEAEGYIRTFAEEGASLTDLLTQVLAARHKGLLSVGDLFTRNYGEMVQVATERVAQQQAAWQPDAPLRERELEILRLIEAGLSNQAISQQLVIAISTVKWHIKQIYNKLNVNSRTQALMRSKELRLL